MTLRERSECCLPWPHVARHKQAGAVQQYTIPEVRVTSTTLWANAAMLFLGECEGFQCG